MQNKIFMSMTQKNEISIKICTQLYIFNLWIKLII